MLWQSQRHEAYREALTWLGEQGLSYYCTCTRARIHAVGGIYDGHCRDLGLGAENAALRLRQTRPVLQFSDRLRGTLIANDAFCPVAPRGGEDAGCGRNEAVRTRARPPCGKYVCPKTRCGGAPHGTGCSVIWLRSYTARKSTMVFSRLSSAASGKRRRRCSQMRSNDSAGVRSVRSGPYSVSGVVYRAMPQP